MNGKGSTPRRVDPVRYGANYDAVFPRGETTIAGSPQEIMQGYNDLLRKFEPTTDIMPQEPT